jgi:hypothetical protein
MRSVLVFAAGILFLSSATGCSDNSSGSQDSESDDSGGSNGSDSGTSSDTTSDSDEPGLDVTLWGERIPGRILGLSIQGRHLWIGTAFVLDPADRSGATALAGLARLDLDSGEVEYLGDELPQETKWIGAVGPVDTADVIEDGDRAIALSRLGLLVIENDAVTLHELEVEPGVKAVPMAMALDRSDSRAYLWVGTNQGLLGLNADTLELEQRFAMAELGTDSVGSLAIDPSTGAVFAALHDLDGPGLGSGVARVLPSLVSFFSPGDQGTGLGSVGDVVFDSVWKAALFAVSNFSAQGGGVLRWDGVVARTVASEGQLGLPGCGLPCAFGPSDLALDSEARLLIVGGRLTSTMSGLLGGGLVVLDLETGQMAGDILGQLRLPGAHVTALIYDPQTKRTYASLAAPCSDVHLGNLGLFALSFAKDGSLQVERPILSGVRSLLETGEGMLVGLRDEMPGASCEGLLVQTGLVRLQSNRSGLLLPLGLAHQVTEILPDAGPVALDAVGDDAFAVGTWRDGTLIGGLADGLVINQALEPGVSLLTSDIAFAGADKVWLSGPATHDNGDPDVLADKGPRGAASFILGPGPSLSEIKHYVRLATSEGEIGGLPSSNVTDILPKGDGSALLGLGIERLRGVYDRDEGQPFVFEGETREGGLAVIDEQGQLSVLQAGAPLSDVRAIALADDGLLHVLDASSGYATWDLSGNSSPKLASLPGPGAPKGSIPRSLWLGKGGDLAATFDTGALVWLGGNAAFLDEFGDCWRMELRSGGGLLIGSDRGLVRVVHGGQDDVSEPAPVEAFDPPFKSFEQDTDSGTDSDCLTQGEICAGAMEDCCEGLVCGGSGFALACVPQ